MVPITQLNYTKIRKTIQSILSVVYLSTVRRVIEQFCVVLEWFVYTSATRRGTGKAVETHESREQYSNMAWLRTCSS